MLDALISGGMKLLGGFVSDRHAAQQQEANRAFQREAAQSGIQWRVEDARKAGIHPLYALGAPTMSPSVSVSPSGVGQALSSMGQDVSRAMRATSTANDRAVSDQLQALTLERAGLQNELLRTQIASMNARTAGQVGPAMPAIGEDNRFAVPQDRVEGRPPLMLRGDRVHTSSGSSPAQAFEDQFGEVGGEVAGLDNLLYSLERRYGPVTQWPVQALERFAEEREMLWRHHMNSYGRRRGKRFERTLR